MKKKVLVAMLCMSMIISNMITVEQVKAEEGYSNADGIVEIDNISDVSVSEIEDADAIVIKDDLYEQDYDLLNETMDNGTGVIIDDEDLERVQQYFDVDEISDYNHQMGCYVYKDGDETRIIPIEANILVEEGGEKPTEEDYDNLIENVELDYAQVNKDFEKITNTDKITEIEEEQLATLQGKTDVGSGFMDNDKTVFFYKQGKCGGTGSTYQYSTKTKISGWSIMGTLDFLIYAINVKTSGKTTYDNVFALTIATPCDGKSVANFYNGISYNSTKNCKIIDYTEPQGNLNSSITGTISTGVSSSGGASSSKSTSYSYNPKGMDVTTKKFTNRVRWYCDPVNDGNEDTSWKINPGVLIKKTDGTTDAVTMTSYVSRFCIWGGTRFYTIETTASCSIKFKNHKKA